jgi:peptidoglycan/LPS O-acetylase OafA/YrhL
LSAAIGGGRRLHELDSLRGLAAMTVVLYHFQLAMSEYFHAQPHGWASRLIDLDSPLYAGHPSFCSFF